MTGREDLPLYRKPPVVEVVIGVRFAPLERFSTTHYGVFWDRIRDGYPVVSDKPPLSPAGEEVRFEVLDMPPLRRVFMVQSETSYLMQLQPDRLLHNWRKLKETDPYPRFHEAKGNFFKAWALFQDFAVEYEIGRPTLQQYEVTYVNHIVASPGSFPMRAQELLHFFGWSQERNDRFLADPTALSGELVFPLSDAKGQLRIVFRHGTRRPDGVDVLQLELSAKGPAAADGTDMDTFLELAHTWIVSGFTDVTSGPWHQIWERVR